MEGKGEGDPTVFVKLVQVPPPAPVATTRRLLLGISLALSASFALYHNLGTAPSVAGTALPQTYAVCSDSKDIWTVDEASPRVECVGINEGYILATGAFEEVQSRVAERGVSPEELTVYKVKSGSVVLPGLADAHAHVLDYGFAMQLPLAGSSSVSEVVDRVRKYILSRPDVLNDTSRWIQGMGWDQTRWQNKEFPTANDLDSDPLLRGRPIALSRVDGHASWVSNTVLDLMGDLPDTVNGGAILRVDGKPTGVFLDNAMGLIPIPSSSPSELHEYAERTYKDALAVGLTSIHDAMSSPDRIAFFAEQAEEGNLPLRLYLMGNVNSDNYWGKQIPKLFNYGKDARLNVRSVKLFTDGALGSWGAALLEPYSDNSNTTGIMRSTPKALSSLVKKFWKDGFQVNIHCIGDRANKVVLDIFEDILASKPLAGIFGYGMNTNVTEMRPRIEHAQIMQLSDIERVGRLGVITSVQPTHATSDMWYAETRLGSERIKGAYAYQTLLQASPVKVLPLGSDFPVEGINPLLGFYAAVSRLSTDGKSPAGDEGWYPAEKLTREQALKGMTLDAAYASFAESELGSLVPGKKADFVVLDGNIMTVPVHKILRSRVTATVIDGALAYGSL
ncbi:hypothetical protein PUNSTDRAFT_145781 [Punctularia strigosozonata HHB-11173 SS5]|uniref:uncharacterized protein n=1 Tax=Punctularia strigosozonata (strain HHB-11173) TaxID=741275 RepID=UPI0004417AE2|nr:uncharacterized protein PUNSTDRAFT_145781 [Punctularia strigosozonata HHB-11173 SS5]EIN05898.1 hypothetical protein PUNSTDRAFT_145781 [Punctularia strigosozonata HHB-11173 SS5]